MIKTVMLKQKVRQKLARWIFNNLSGDRDRYCTPPGAECKLEFGEGGTSDLATTHNNDGFELWLGRPDKWYIFYSAKQARKLAWFILWEWWAKSTWFGLKRRLWYWGLGVQTSSLETQADSATLPVPRPSHLGDETGDEQ